MIHAMYISNWRRQKGVKRPALQARDNLFTTPHVAILLLPNIKMERFRREQLGARTKASKCSKPTTYRRPLFVNFPMKNDYHNKNGFAMLLLRTSSQTK